MIRAKAQGARSADAARIDAIPQPFALAIPRMSDTVLFARQPIYDTKHRVFGYELLFREGQADRAEFSHGSAATASVLLDAFSALPVEDVLNGKPAFINFTAQLLNQPPPVDPSRVVIEVLEEIEITPEVLQALKTLKRLGYSIALDDYVFLSGHEPLLALANIVKIDVLNTPLDDIKALVERLQSYPLTLLAEKVETLEMFKLCLGLGFRLFQGYYHGRPMAVSGRRLTPSQRGAMLLLDALQKNDISLAKLEEIIRTDAVLALKIMQLVNSAFIGVGREVTSIKRAITLLGIEKIRSMSTLLVLAGLEGKLPALFASSLLRARVGQLLAEHSSVLSSEGDQQFTVGLFSNLDAYLDMGLEQIIERLPFAPAVREAIVNHTGASGQLLDCAIALDQADLDQIDWRAMSTLGIDKATLLEAYIESLGWVSSVLNSLD
ncbi:MAG: hypothetical protein JWM78_2046 [Verrucomicrobiaceae bacterium]|nr:hypothetical protein [Verrucomicrobiaceae bacterium]